jgi:D-3-phosphoglycerate dehydrogenase
MAKAAGITIREVNSSVSEDYVNLITLRCENHRSISGTFSAIPGRRSEQRIVEVDGHGFDVPPAEHMLVITNDDRPGVIGTVGTILGNHSLNISDMDVGRVPASDLAMMLLATTTEVPAEVIDELRAAPGMLSVDALHG